MSTETMIATPIAPEDIEKGAFVAVLHVVGEHVPMFCPEWLKENSAPKQLLWLPPSGIVLKVLDVCLPFVLAKGPDGKSSTLDVRRYRFARVSERFARRVFKRTKPEGAQAATSTDADEMI